MPDELLELAARCEAAEGPDRELDALIACAHRGLTFIILATGDEAYGDICDPTDSGYGTPNKCTRGLTYARFPNRLRGRLGGGKQGNIVQGFSPEQYTASIDAALTLVPEGHSWDLAVTEYAVGARVYPNGTQDIDNPHLGCATPALALCFAALRARAELAKGDALEGRG